MKRRRRSSKAKPARADEAVDELREDVPLVLLAKRALEVGELDHRDRRVRGSERYAGLRDAAEGARPRRGRPVGAAAWVLLVVRPREHHRNRHDHDGNGGEHAQPKQHRPPRHGSHAHRVGGRGPKSSCRARSDPRNGARLQRCRRLQRVRTPVTCCARATCGASRVMPIVPASTPSVPIEPVCMPGRHDHADGPAVVRDDRRCPSRPARPRPARRRGRDPACRWRARCVRAARCRRRRRCRSGAARPGPRLVEFTPVGPPKWHICGVGATPGSSLISEKSFGS